MDSSSRRSVYDLFSRALGNPPITGQVAFRLVIDLLPQIVIGHRLWAAAANKNERFIRAERISFLHRTDTKEIWTIIDLKKSDLRALKVDAQNFLVYSRLEKFGEIEPKSIVREPVNYLESIIRLEQRSPQVYVFTPGRR
jgi:hypothetical protein